MQVVAMLPASHAGSTCHCWVAFKRMGRRIVDQVFITGAVLKQHPDVQVLLSLSTSVGLMVCSLVRLHAESPEVCSVGSLCLGSREVCRDMPSAKLTSKS